MTVSGVDTVVRATLADRLSARLNDPTHALLRRGLRVGLLVPLVFFVLERVLGLSAAALPAAFATYTILAFADFGGPTLDRLRANVTLGLFGVVMIAVGSYANSSGWLAVLTTFVVVFTISFASVLRGYFAAGSLAAIVPWVLVVASPHDIALMPQKCVGWAIGAAVAAVGALVLWPSHARSDLRLRLAQALEAASVVVDELTNQVGGGAVEDAYEQLRDGIADAHACYDGRLVRPGVGTSRDRSLMLAFDQLDRLRIAVHAWVDLPANQRRAGDVHLGHATAQVLRESAESLRRGYGVIDVGNLERAREHHTEHLVARAQEELELGDSEHLHAAVASAFHVRVAAIATQVLATYVQGALDSRDHTIGRRASRSQPVTFAGMTVIDPMVGRPVRELVTAQVSLESPWFRTALRTATALALTVLVVELTGTQFGFWVSLGAFAALRLDAPGTRRTAVSVFVGTLVGFVIAVSLVLIFGGHLGVYWALLPVTAFLAAYTPGAISLAVGQGSFTVFILTIFAIVDPRALSPEVFRVGDVLLGLVVSLAVSALIWPRGIVPLVQRRLHVSIVAVGDFLVAAYARLVEGPVAQHSVDVARDHARRMKVLADETFDLALSQGGRNQLTDVPTWTSVLNCASQISFAAELVSVLDSVTTLPDDYAESKDAMLAQAHHIQSDVARSSYSLETGRVQDRLGLEPSQRSMERLQRLVDDDLRHMSPRADPQAGLQAVVLLLATSWLVECRWVADRLSDRVTASLTDPDQDLQTSGQI